MSYNLPLKDYYELEWIEANGTQYINTGYVSNVNVKVVVDYQAANTTQMAVFGGRLNSAVGLSFWTDGWMHFGAASTCTGSYAPLAKHHVEMSKLGCFVDGVSQNCNIGTNFGGTAIRLFQTDNNNTTDYRVLYGKIFSCRIYDNDILVRDLIPALRKSDSKAGMYDKSTGNFYTNASGNNNFIYQTPLVFSDYKTVVVHNNTEYNNYKTIIVNNNQEIINYKTLMSKGDN